jgi:hypothetical protein
LALLIICELISHAQSPTLFSNRGVFLVLSGTLEAAVEHLTMEILLNLNAAVSQVLNLYHQGIVVFLLLSCWRRQRADRLQPWRLSSARFLQVIPQATPLHHAVACGGWT